MIYRVKKPLGETSKLLRSRVTLVLQTSILVPQTTHFVLQGKPSTSFSGYSQFKGGQMRLQVRHRISETEKTIDRNRADNITKKNKNKKKHRNESYIRIMSRIRKKEREKNADRISN